MSPRYTRIDTPLGPMFAVAVSHQVTRLDFLDAKYAPEIDPGWAEDERDEVLRACSAQLTEYFAGRRQVFDLPLAAQGTEFQRSVWRQISRVPHGGTITYGELARRASATSSARAAGTATGRNPIAVVVPCHRILGGDGKLTGYAGGLARKIWLLEHEGVLLRDPRPLLARG